MLSEADRLTIEGQKSSIPLLPMSANDKYLAKCFKFSCQGLKDDDQLNPPTAYIHEQDQCRFPHRHKALICIKTKTGSNSSTTTFNKDILLHSPLFALPGLKLKGIIWPVYPNLVTNRNNMQRQGVFQTDYKKTDLD